MAWPLATVEQNVYLAAAWNIVDLLRLTYPSVDSGVTCVVLQSFCSEFCGRGCDLDIGFSTGNTLECQQVQC